MRADKVLKAIITREGYSPLEAARTIGKSDTYFSSMFARGSIPKADTMAGICDEFGYDLIVRDQDDGFEILINPPE